MSKVPVNLQFELALLWRTLNIIKNIDGLSVVDFYEKFLPTLKAMPNLSLSTYWEEVSNYLAAQNSDQWKFKSIVGVPVVPLVSQDGNTAEAKNPANNLMSIPELDYLKFDERIDHKHDPLQVIHNLYGVAAAYTVDASPYNQSVLLSTCLAVAVKSGRASLMLHVASMISTVISNSCDPEAPYISIDLDPLKDVLNLLAQRAQPAVALPATNNEHCEAEQESEIIRYEKDPLLTHSTLDDRVRVDGVGPNRKGMVLSFGKADHGKLGHGDVQLHRLVPTLIESLQDVDIRKTASMSTYSVAIDAEGAVYVWGTGGPAGAMQSSKTDIQPQLLEALPVHAKVIDVSCGLGHALFLLHTGRVYSWGNGGNGRLGLGDTQDRSEACPVVLLQHERVTAVQCGASHSMALTTTGRVYSWGKNTQGQCGHGNIDDHIKPTPVRKLEEHVIIQLAAGWEHSLALTQEGRIYSWGSGYKDNRRGVVPPVLGLGHNEARQSPELVASIESVKIINIACGWDHCLAVDEHGKVLSWGSGQNGKLGLGTEENVSLPCYIPTLDCDDECNNPKDAKSDNKHTKNEPKKRLFVTHLSAGCEHTAVLTQEGEVYAWGHGDGGRLGHGTNAQCLVPTKVESVALMGVTPTSVHCGDKCTMILANAPESATPVAQRKNLPHMASTGSTTDFNNAYFSETKMFLQENLRDADVAQMQHKLNLQTLESTQILKSLLVLMASASLPRADAVELKKEPDMCVPEIMSLVTRFTTHSAQLGAHISKKTNNSDANNDELLLRGFDREYAVECADSTYNNLLQLLDTLMVPFQLSLSSLVSRGDRSSSNAISAQISSLSLQSVAENVFSTSVNDLVHGNNNNLNEDNNQNSHMASFRSASVTLPDSAGQEAQKIVDQFESLYSLLIILTANVEVLAQRCEGLKKSPKGNSDDSYHVRAKDWRNIQRELGRLLPISFEESLNTGRSLQTERSEQSRQRRRRSTGTGQDDPDPDDEDPDDFHADGDAECSLGSMESEEHLLQSMARQHQHQHQLGRREFAQSGESDSRHSDHPHHRRHQQDQQSDDDDHREYHDENSASAYEGEERDFGADSGDDSFFSGDRSRMRAGTDYDASFNAEEDRTFYGGDMSPLSNTHSHLAPAALSSARGRHQSDRVGDSSVETSSRAGDWERDRDGDQAAYGSRSGSPAQSLDSLTHPRTDEPFDRVHSREQEEGYLTENSYSDSQDSRYGRRGGSAKPRGGAAGHRRDEEEDDDGDMERYYEEQALGMENLDLQRAIISSMQENASDMPYETLAYRGTAAMYDGTPGRFGEGIGLSTADSQPAIPRIRDVLNSLASRCYLAIDTISRQSVMKEGKSFKSEASVNTGDGSGNYTTGGVGDPVEGTAVQSVFLLWEAVQVATNTGYEVLYTELDQKAVLCQLVRSPSQFLYIFPGVLNGASRHNTLYASLHALFPSNEALFTASDTNNNMVQVSEDSLDLRSILAFLNYVNLYIRTGNDILPTMTKVASGFGSSANLTAKSKIEAANPNSVEIYAVKIHTSITAALVTLSKHLLRVLLDRVEASDAFLNDTIGLRPEQPWGSDMAKVLEIVADCVASDIEVLTNKVDAFNDDTELRFAESFTANVLGFLYSRVLARPSVVQSVALLPTSMRLLRLFQATYDSHKRPMESKERFNAWLMGSFQWVVYHVTGVVNTILHPSSALMPPPLRPTVQVCKDLLSAVDVRKHLLDASSSNTPYSWEQQVWSALHRADPTLSRNSSTLSTSDSAAAADILRNADTQANLLTGADVGLLLLNGIMSECMAVGDLCQSLFFAQKSAFVQNGLSELTRFFSTPVEHFQEKYKRGEECLWTTLSTSVQLYVSILHTLCVSGGLNWSNLIQMVGQANKAAPTSKSNVLSLLGSSSDLATFVSLMIISLVIAAAAVESTAEVSHIVNKTAFLKSVLTQSKQLTTSGYVLTGVTSAGGLLVPIAVVKEAATASIGSATNSDKWQLLIHSHILPAKQSIETALLASKYWLDAAVHSQLTLTVKKEQVVDIEPAHATSHSHDTPSKLAVFLLTKNLSLHTLAQLTLWEDDSLKNQQYALSLLVYLSECLQHCPEVMHYCAESLQSFGDPLEALEHLHYALSNSTTSVVSPRKDRANGSPSRSSNYKVEQLLSKLDAQLVAKITSLPSHTAVTTRNEEIRNILSGFGQPTLKQIPDLLTFLRHGMIANAQFGLDAQGVADVKASAVAAVSLNPFSTALKKTADVIAALLASHPPGENPALSLQDVLSANKYINLLQATLGGLASMQGIDAQQKAHAAAQTARSSSLSGPDKANDKSAFLHALCGVLNPLGSLMKVLVNSFQKHLLFGQAVGVQFLSPSIKAIEHSSPTLLSNVFTPQGNYSLGFWLYLPPIEMLLPETKAVDKELSAPLRIHLLSRVYETGEMNLLSLLGNNLTEAAASFSLTVHVVVEDAFSDTACATQTRSKAVYLEVTISATDFTSSSKENLNASANARSRAVKKVSIRSKPLAALEWISCVVELVQDSVPQVVEANSAIQSAVGGAAKAQARRNYKTKYLDTTCVALFVNNSLQSATSLSAGRSSLYQSMIIGKIPNKLGVAAGEKEQIFLTDVFWVPTSVYLSSAGSEYEKMRAFLTKLGAEGLIYTPSADKEFTSNGQSDYYRNFLPVSPPSLLLETIDNAFHCASQLLELLKAHLKAVPATTIVTTSVNAGVGSSVGGGTRPVEGHPGNTLPLNLIPIVCTFVADVVCIADARAQESAFQTLAALLESIPHIAAPSGSGSTLDLSKSPAGSAFNAAVQNKASLAVKQAIVFCMSLLNDFFHTHPSASNDSFELSFLTESPYALKPTSNRDIWQKRLQLGRISIERSLRIAEWGIRITLDENLIASGVASLLALAVRNGLGDTQFQQDCGLFAMLVAGGGWAPTVSVGRFAQLTPRKLFLHSDARAYEQCAFPTTAYVAGGAPNRPGVWLGQCLGAYQRIDAVPALMPLVPRTLRAAILSTEMVSTRDLFAVLTMPQLNAVLKNYALQSADELIAILKAMVAPTNETDKSGLSRNKSSHSRALLAQFESAAANDPSNSATAEEIKLADEAQAALRQKDQYYLDLMQEMAFLRLLSVQLTHAAQTNQKPRTEAEDRALRNQLDTLRATVLKNLENLLSLAVQDPVQAVSAIFSSGTFKGVQLDVLKNLLKEGDISFLERISLRLWKQYKLDINPSCESGYGTASVNTSLIQIASLAGEVVISETKIRAQTHFPTVRLLGVSIQRMTGRWFYECTLLSDGLIQMGWANAMFRCDPICGQGVGDHNHSWAFDGLRCKKWNVSCEPYGRRWKLGDTVGTLIDMDLLEIRFYLNGEDLGQAFEDFSSHDVFPALSLNLRQCVRLNFGQYKFLHPPDEMDGKPFRPVIAALQLPKPSPALVKPAPTSAMKKATSSPGVSLSSLKSPSAEPAGGDTTERGTPTANQRTPVQDRSAQGPGGTEYMHGTPLAVPMTPLRQALTSNMNTPAGAETPTTYVLTPAQTPSIVPNESMPLLEPIAEASAPTVTFSTPPRTVQTAEVSAALVLAENQTEEQENEAATQMQMDAWDAAQQQHQAAARARAAVHDPYLVQHGNSRYDAGHAEEDEGDQGERDLEDAEGLERELQRELEEHERELLAEREYEREEDREEEDDEEEEDEDDEEMDAEDELRERNRDNDDLDEAEEVNAHLVEMRRQAMIENLVNMGLPEEWAIRAAQQTDISRSETAAITWIIERMELEQSGHAGGMSQEEEDFDESEQDLDYFMNRNPAAFRLQRSESENSGTSGPAGGNMALSTHSQRLLAMQRGVNPIDGNNSSLSGGMSGLASGSGVSPGGSPTREEIYGLRRNLANVLAEDDAVSRGTTKSTSMGKANARGMSTWNNGQENKVFDDMAGATAWNADLSVPPVLIGQYVARRRHDQDKQEVLAQVVELDQADMLPIIIACEFSLCIYYARAVLLRSAAFIDNKFCVGDVDLEGVAKGMAEANFITTDSTSDNTTSEPRSGGALNQLGLPLLASLLMHSTSEPAVIVDLFKICFKQHVVGLTQPDRLFPLVANGNVLGEARDRVPLISPFVSANANKLHGALARLELQLFHGLEGTLAVDESSMQGLDTLSKMLNVAIYYANEVSLPALTNTGSPLSITSNLRELQSQLLRNLGVSVDAGDLSWVDKFAAGCKLTLYNLVHEALECLQAATSAKYDSFDWILLSLDRQEKPAEPLATPSSFKAEAASLLSQQQENAPAVAYAYWLLRSVLVKSEVYTLHSTSKTGTAKSDTANSTSEPGPTRPEGKPAGGDFSPNRSKASPGGRSANNGIPAMSAVDYLTSADTLAKLLKISATQNVSLRFCAHDLSALILSRVNVSLSATMAQSVSETVEAGAPSPQIAASEYYITIAKEKRMLQMFGAHMKAEVQDRRMITRYTRSIGAFLFQWHLLRRQLGLSSVNYMHEYLMADLSIHTENTAEPNNALVRPSAYSRTAISDLAEALTMSPQTLQRSQRKEATPEKADPTWYGVRITQLTSNSVTVDWSLDPVKFPPRIRMPEFGLVEYPPAPATTHEANLYFTPASHMGLEAPVLVLSGLEQNGTFHIDDLDADTLYKITITKDNAMNTSSDQEDEGEDSELAAHQEITLAMQARSVALLSYFDNGAPISSPQKDTAVAAGTLSPASSVETTPAPGIAGQSTVGTVAAVDTSLVPYSPASTPGKSLAPFPALLDLQPHSARGPAMDRSVARLKSSSGSANPIVKSGGELVPNDEAESSAKDEVMMFISTESEAPFQFDLENMSPNLLVSPHSLTLLNQSNKKWSTARANVRLTSGVHRWDVHIDRCVSKNIFIGVAAREAHLNNYVGCDKFGWAFLANKAVWHNKSKTKTYGDLFRSGDTVTVILDLEEGTLAFNLNNKSLGVAVEGLVGPLYPAFSLYNEGDQLTVVKVRSAAGESGGAGSCAAEKILERIETFNNLLTCVAESFHVEATHCAAASPMSGGETAQSTASNSPSTNIANITEELG